MKLPRGRAAFTLVELLVVIAIIGVLVALLLPAIQAAREAARRAQCMNGLKQMGLGILNFDSAKGRFPAGATTVGSAIDGRNSSTWTVDILPYAEQQQLFNQWDKKVDFNHANNKRLRETYCTLYRCPVDVGLDELYRPESGQGTGQDWAPGSYRGVSGTTTGTNGDHYWDNPLVNRIASQAAMPDTTRGPLPAVLESLTNADDRKMKPVAAKNIPDGTSNTLLVGEFHTTTQPGPQLARRGLWCYAYTSYNVSSASPKPRTWTLTTDYNACALLDGGQHNCKRGWGSLHTGNIIQFVRCDGGSKTVSMNIDLDILRSLCTVAGEESLVETE